LNKILVIAGIAIVAISKVTIIKSILVDQPAYERCLSGSLALKCGTDPLTYFMIGWIITAVGAIVVIYGLRASQKISR
jgi:NADH:ubiquinone oxidoreductase subunit 5 (subunit L)/multisubunit Na+/H+ antiporter MnhA subunit